MMKYAIIRKKIDNIIYELLVQSTGDVVMLPDGTSLNAKIAQIVSAFANIVTVNVIDEKIDNSANELYTRVTGFGEGTTINEAYDTIKEIAEWLTTETPTSAQDIVDDISDLSIAIKALEEAATKVVDSSINGNIIVDGNEVTVYEHPETHEAAMIVESDDKQFVSKTEKTAWNAKEELVYVNASDENADFTTLTDSNSHIITIDDMTLNINYQNSDGEFVDVNGDKVINDVEVGSSKFIQFTIPDGYHVTSISTVIDDVESAIIYNTAYNNVVSFTVSNIGNLTYSDKGVPSFTTNYSIKVVLDITTVE